MSDGIAYADILILALIAGFILLRLRSVLGQKMGNEDNDPASMRPIRPAPARPDEPVVQLGDKSLKFKIKEPEPDTYLQNLTVKDVADTLVAIKARDPQFIATEFLQGAKMAYEMVFDAFAKGDKPTLKYLLADDIYNHFASEIDARAASDRKVEITLVSVRARDITKASFNGNMARLSVLFANEQITLIRDASGQVIEGNASDAARVEDEWAFERDVTSKNPNWKIIET